MSADKVTPYRMVKILKMLQWTIRNQVSIFKKIIGKIEKGSLTVRMGVIN